MRSVFFKVFNNFWCSHEGIITSRLVQNLTLIIAIALTTLHYFTLTVTVLLRRKIQMLS